MNYDKERTRNKEINDKITLNYCQVSDISELFSIYTLLKKIEGTLF